MTDDWRLMGQERVLQGATLYWTAYRQPSPNWDHDHCAFCWVRFMERGAVTPDDALQEGYCTEDRYHWVCESCAKDFVERFAFRLFRP